MMTTNNQSGFLMILVRLLLGLLFMLGTHMASAEVLYVHTDHLGTPRLMTNEQGATVWRNLPTTEPFGTSPAEEDPDGDSTTTTLNPRFPGQYYDKEVNTHYNYFRDYDPSTGRYISPDPIGLAGGPNLYAYVDNAPTMKTDPLGLAPGMRIPGFPIPIRLPGGGSGASGGSSSGDSGSGGVLEKSIPGGSSGAGGGSGSGAGSGSGSCPPDDDFCRKRKQYCFSYCQYELDFPGRTGHDNTARFRACVRKCMNDAGCSY